MVFKSIIKKMRKRENYDVYSLGKSFKIKYVFVFTLPIMLNISVNL